MFIIINLIFSFCRHISPCLPTRPDCGHTLENKNKHGFSCRELNMQDIRRFFQGFYITCNKIEQDQFIARYAREKVPQRHRTQNLDRKRGMSIDYFIQS